jgi:hypothetical protein
LGWNYETYMQLSTAIPTERCKPNEMYPMYANKKLPVLSSPSTRLWMYSTGPSSETLEGMRKMWCGWWHKEGNVSTIHNESIEQVRPCYVCDIYMLISCSNLSVITRSKYNSERADSVLVTEHRLLVAGISSWRRLMSNIFRTDNSCAHQISNDLVIGTVAFLIAAPPLSPYLAPQGFRAQTHTVYS